MKEVFKKTEIGIKYAFLFVFLGVGTMVSSIMLAVEPVFDDFVTPVAIAGLLMLLFSLLFTWDLFTKKSWHKLLGLLSLAWAAFLIYDIVFTFVEMFFLY